MNPIIQSQTGYTGIQASPNLAMDVRMLLRKLGLFHSFKRANKLVTIDVPFHIKHTPDGQYLVILLDKACLPRKFPLESLLASQDTLQKQFGVSVDIRYTRKWIAFCLKVG